MRLRSYLRENITDSDIQRDFIKWAEKIWGESFTTPYNEKRTVLVFRENPKHKFLMSVIYNPRGVRVIGDFIFGIAPKYEITWSPRLKSEDKDIYEKTIKHEVLHLGLSKHDREFKRMASKWGTSASEMSIKGEKPILKVQIRPRKYQKVDMEFENEDEASTYARMILKSGAEKEAFKKKYGIEGPLRFKIKY